MPNQELIITRPMPANDLVASVADAVSLGEIVAKSGMFPDVTTAAQAVVKILAGREIGVPPLAALRGIHVIRGKAEIGAGLLAAMIKASGKYSYTVHEHTDQICILDWFEHGKPVGYSQFTIEDAKRANLVKPDSNWQKFPKAMVFARALTAGQRVYAPDVAIGAAYAPGEIGEVEIEESALTPPITIDAALDPLSERIGQLLREAGEEDASGARRHGEAMLYSGAFQSFAKWVKVSVEDIVREFGHLHKSDGTLTIKKEPVKYDAQNRAHNAESASRFDAVVMTLKSLGVQVSEILAEVNAILNPEGTTGRREISTRYELTDREVETVSDYFEGWAKSLAKKAAKKAKP